MSFTPFSHLLLTPGTVSASTVNIAKDREREGTSALLETPSGSKGPPIRGVSRDGPETKPGSGDTSREASEPPGGWWNTDPGEGSKGTLAAAMVSAVDTSALPWASSASPRSGGGIPRVSDAAAGGFPRMMSSATPSGCCRCCCRCCDDDSLASFSAARQSLSSSMPGSPLS